MTRVGIENEIKKRAEWHKPQTHVIADYYRIRRKVAYPLPLREMILPQMPVRGIATYPWSIWVLWDFEERVNSLGWAATWFDDVDAKALVIRDLEALAGWACYRQYERPDLSLGHCARLLWLAYTQWAWLGDTKGKIEAAFERIVDDALKYSDEHHGRFHSKEDILALDEPHSVLHNIPLIGTVGIALAAHALDHEAKAVLDQRLLAVMGAILDLRAQGHSEGVGYDGYIMDFVVHWLQAMDVTGRQAIMDHARFGDLLDESVALGAPGDVANVAEIGDVEPKEMPYHLAAHAKLWPFTQDARAAWLLSHTRLDWMRADALGVLHDAVDHWSPQAPSAGTLDAHYTTVLRSGWDTDDLAVAMSASNSPMGHLQNDSGTLVIGSRGRWLIDDPGYQQYMKTTEREYTLNAQAHNAPVINGQAQARKLSTRNIQMDTLDDSIYRMSIDLTACYSDDLKLDLVKRTVWLSGNDLVVVGDQISGAHIEQVNYYWHGHPDVAWWVSDNWAQIYFSDALLWAYSPQAQIADADVDRLSGSRGQLTLCTETDRDAPIIWWVFCIGDIAPEVECDAQILTVGEQSFSLA